LTDARGATCVARACTEGHLDAVRRLYTDKRVDFNQPDDFGYCPVHRAIAGGHIDAAHFLLDKGVSADCKTVEAKPSADGIAAESRFEAPLHLAARTLGREERLVAKPPRYDAFELLLRYHADPTLGDKNGDTFLHFVVRQRDYTGIWLCFSLMGEVGPVMATRNVRGRTLVEDADAVALGCGLVVRAAAAAPPGVRERVAGFLLSDWMACWNA